MPLYEYSCEKCGKVFEVMQKFADEPLQVHADCGGAVIRLLSAPALHFKGSGFYITDYAKGGSSDSGKKSDGKSADGSSNNTPKADGAKSESSANSDKGKSDSGGGGGNSTPAPATAGSTKGDS